MTDEKQMEEGVVDFIEWRYELQELRRFISKCFSDQKEVMEHLHSTTNASGAGGYGARSSFARNSFTMRASRSGSPVVQFDVKRHGDLSESSSNSSQESIVRASTAVHRLRAEMKDQNLRLSKKIKVTSREFKLSRGLFRSWANVVSSSQYFANFVSLCIIFNVILLGVEVDVAGSLSLEEAPTWLWIMNALIVGLFVVEIIVKWIALGWDFWVGPEYRWNIFDLVIILISVVDAILDRVAEEKQANLRLFRSIRLARALRTFRVFRIFRHVTALRTLVLSIVSPMGSLFWTLMLLLILFYSFGVVVTQIVSDHCRWLASDETGMDIRSVVPSCPAYVAKYWHSVPESMLTLFMAITNGVSWDDAVEPLRSISGLAVAFVCIYVAIAVFAVLNVVTGVFCNTAIESATIDKEVATLKQVHTKDQQVQALQAIFLQIDKAHTREVSFQDVQDAMTKGDLSNFMNAMGISTDDVWTLCMLLDADKSGSIDLDEFVSGCMQLHGPAKSLQLAKMSFENKLTRQAIKALAEELLDIKQYLIGQGVSEGELTEAF